MNKAAAYLPGSEIQRVQSGAVWVGISGFSLCLLGAYWNRVQFFHSYLFAFLFWTGIALGCLAIMMLHHLTAGAWGMVIRRLLESGSKTLALMAFLFVPLIFGLRSIYSWTQPIQLPSQQLEYLNIPFFIARAALYFLIWLWIVYLLGRWSQEQERGEGSRLLRKMRLLSGPGLVLYGLTASFAAIDWIMSLEPHWYSTIFGLLVIGGQVLSAMAFVIVALVLLAARQPLVGIVQPRHFHDLGKLLLAFVMIWAYLAFSQLLIIWSGNLTEEIPWYLHRWQGGWLWIGILLIVFHFALPFFLLLSRDLKRSGKTLAILAMFLLLMRAMDLFWLVVPGFSPERFRIHWMDVAASIGVGGLWLAFFIWQLKKRSLLPVGDPQLPPALERTHE
ncbi:MAG: hypothetical protein HY313_10835 [Acidobacteria bacterium]|nr:hypothetical protein [Acidobacteriota bacterium]